MECSGTLGKISLQKNMVNITFSRLLLEIFTTPDHLLIMFWKWGFDGSSGHTLDQYKKGSLSEETLATDGYKRVFLAKRFFLFPLLASNNVFDGKCTHALTAVSSHAVCDVCKAKPSQLNKISAFEKKPLDHFAWSLGLSPLHARIRALEYFFNVAIKLPLKIGRLTKLNKELAEPVFKANKIKLQKEFK
eukprot:Pompholyxophrys_punicea_v1_NODE_470_length_1882_cov_22.671593.p1 type:complete len:190 gc:universal NODE_470_length_1882_cov_22.671593:820-251(-)